MGSIPVETTDLASSYMNCWLFYALKTVIPSCKEGEVEIKFTPGKVHGWIFIN